MFIGPSNNFMGNVVVWSLDFTTIYAISVPIITGVAISKLDQGDVYNIM